jgi:pimeloyl-ACP methyl ester carboxylesterase
MGAKVASVLQLLEAGNIEGGVRYFVETVVFGPGAWDMIPPEVRETVIFNAPSFVDEMRDPEFLSRDDARLRRISRPVLLTCGQESPRVFRSIIEKLSQVLPEAHVITFPGVVHEPEDQQPAAYVEAVTQFVEGVSKRARAYTA